MSPAVADPDRWRRAARIAAAARGLGVRLAVPGASRRVVADRIEAFVREQGAEPAFPVNLSRNVEAAHYTPSPDDTATLVAGDLLKIDVGAHLDGAIADTAVTVEVGEGRRHERLVRAVDEALRAGIARVRAGATVNDVGVAVETAVHRHGLKPVRNLMGHSIERYLLHAGKSVPNVSGIAFEPFEEGEVVALEPFVTNGRGEIENGPFGNIVRFRSDPGDRDRSLAGIYRRFRTLPFALRWVTPEERHALQRVRGKVQRYPVFVEAGGGLVAQAEHTLLVRSDGAEVLTAP